MVLWAGAIIAGGTVGLATGGSLAGLAAVHFRAWWLLVVAVVLEASLGAVPVASRGLVAVAACLAVAGWCAANRQPGWHKSAGHALLALGIVLNATVMALNAGMPVSSSALAAAGLPKTMDVARGDFYKHAAMTSHTRFAGLGDTVPFHFARTVLSPGDLLMLAGIAALAWGATRQPSTRAVRLAKLASRTRPGPAGQERQ
jgi:hypothetical protein